MAWAKALLLLESQNCAGCGHPLTETTDATSEGQYTAHLARCHACATAGAGMRAFSKDGSDTTGMQVRVTRDDRRRR